MTENDITSPTNQLQNVTTIIKSTHHKYSVRSILSNSMSVFRKVCKVSLLTMCNFYSFFTFVNETAMELYFFFLKKRGNNKK